MVIELSLFVSFPFQSHRNLSQLPNFAFSIPLALFHSSSSSSSKDIPTSDDSVPTEADSRLQDALLMFPSVLLPLMEKCSVNLDPRVIKHSFFADAELSKWANISLGLQVPHNFQYFCMIVGTCNFENLAWGDEGGWGWGGGGGDEAGTTMP